MLLGEEAGADQLTLSCEEVCTDHHHWDAEKLTVGLEFTHKLLIAHLYYCATLKNEGILVDVARIDCNIFQPIGFFDDGDGLASECALIDNN